MKAIKNKVVNAIMQGAHTTDTIMRNQGLYGRYNEVCKALAGLQTEGIVEYHSDNMANEYGYYLTEPY